MVFSINMLHRILVEFVNVLLVKRLSCLLVVYFVCAQWLPNYQFTRYISLLLDGYTVGLN